MLDSGKMNLPTVAKPVGILLKNASQTSVTHAQCFIRHRLWGKKKVAAGSWVEEKSSQREGDTVRARGHYLNT